MCCFGIPNAVAKNSASITVDTNYQKALSYLIAQRYDDAQSVLKSTEVKSIIDLRKRYLAFATEQTRILDYESYIVDQKSFQTHADSLKETFKQALPKFSGADSTECLFYLANIYGGISVMLAKTGKYIDGVKNAMKSVSLLKQVKRRDSLFYAADLGIGVFDYYLSTSFSWVPFIDKKEQSGLDGIKEALKAEFPYNYAAKNSYCWILIERKEYAKADSIAVSVLDVYPKNTIFLRIRALIALWSGNYTEAKKRGTSLITISNERKPRNWSDMVAGYTVLVQSNYETGNKKGACAAAEKLLSMPIPKTHRRISHVKKNIKYISSVAKKCKRKGK